MALEIETFEPSPALRGHVASPAVFRETGPPTTRPELPVTGVVLILVLGDRLSIDGNEVGSFVAGVHDRPVRTGHFGEQSGVNAYLDPLAARRILGMPLAELTNRTVPMRDVFGREADELTERAQEAPTAAARWQVLDDWLAARLQAAPEPRPVLVHTLGRISATHGAMRMDALARETGFSRRHIAGVVGQEIGVPPKTLARLARMQRAGALLREGRDLADVAFSSGFADQPHFNREFRAFTGVAPSEFPFVQDAAAAA